MKVLVTGAGGFIGYHLTQSLLSQGFSVWGLDNFSNFYSPDLKKSRIKELKNTDNFSLIESDLCDLSGLTGIIEQIKPQVVIHLAAQAGVRIPVQHSQKYIDSNISASLNLLLSCKSTGLKDISFIYASSSSVYGDETQIPYDELSKGLKPKSIYGISKYTNELMASILTSELGIRTRGLRFFTVYGEWGRPDMAYFRLGNAAINHTAFKLFGNGNVSRDFTYVDDVIRNILLLMEDLDNRNRGFHDVVNIGGGRPLSMNFLIEQFNRKVNHRMIVEYQDGFDSDSKATMASTKYLESLVGKQEFTHLETGIDKLFTWFNKESIRPRLENWVKSSFQ